VLGYLRSFGICLVLISFSELVRAQQPDPQSTQPPQTSPQSSSTKPADTGGTAPVGKTAPTTKVIEKPQRTRAELVNTDTDAILRSARLIHVTSRSLLVRAAVVEEKMQKQPEFRQFDLRLTREPAEADLILELRHDLFTQYVYSVVDTKTGLIVASGKLSSLGGTVADKVAQRFMKQIRQAQMRGAKRL